MQGKAVVTLSGNCGNEWKRDVASTGKVIFTNTLAVTTKGRAGEHTSWYKLTVFGENLSWIAEYGKGSRLIIIGDLAIKTYNEKKYAEVIVDKVLGGEKKGSGQASSSSGNSYGSYGNYGSDDSAGYEAAFADDMP